LPEVPEFAGHHSGFRSRARLAIRGRLGSPKIGLFETGTHRVVHIPNCSVQHPLINRVAGAVRRALADARVTTYSDKAHLGLARYLQVVIERNSQTAQVVLVANSASPVPLAGCFDLIRERLGSDLHSLWFNANQGTGNAILGPDWVHWYGPPAVVERFGGAAVHYPPGAFGQSNLEIAQAIIEHVRTLVPCGARVMEFYAGVGAIGLSIVDRVGKITMNEVSPQSLQGLDQGLAALDPAARAKVSVAAGPAAACMQAADAQVIIVDPPRRGLDLEFTQHLRDSPPERLVYISCSLDSLLQDVARLTSGRLKLRQLTAFNLMPFTEHVETVAYFEPVQ
jgi:tRNA/tmRNA/rRNA uracil-C5-methylase (TrmA/RlmC/RlmD family)